MNQRSEIHRREAATPLQGANLRNAEHRTETVEQHVGFDSRTVEHLCDAVVLDHVHAFGHVGKQGANMRGRGPQIMGYSVTCALDLRHQPFDFLEHVIHEMREHIQLVAAADRQTPVQVTLCDPQGYVANIAHTPHLPQVQQQATDYAHQQAKQAPANQRVDHRLSNMQDVRKVAGDHDLFAALPTHAHGSDDWRFRLVGDDQAIVERITLTIERQVRRQGADIAGEMGAVGGEQPEVVGIQMLAFSATENCRGKFRVVDGPEVEELPMKHRVRVELHARGCRPADESDQDHDRQREDDGVDRKPPEGRVMPTAPHFYGM